MRLKNTALFRTEAYINGMWAPAGDGRVFPVVDPATQEVIAEVADLGVADTQRAIDASKDAFGPWSRTTAGHRSKLLNRWYDLIRSNAADLATLLTQEQGKPIKESMGEVLYGASFIKWFAEEARRVYGDVIPAHTRDTRIVVIKQPIGPVAAITPWNFPNAMITRKIAPAIAAGCTVVVKPAEDTPLSALALAALAEEAGFPAGVINIVPTSEPAPVGLELTKNPAIRKVSFTGSTEVGKLLMEQSAGTVKKVSLELGGNAPFIVFDDADCDAAVDGALASKYRNAGQTCVCANRIYVQTGIHDTFVERLVERVKDLQVGNGLMEETDVGPLINDEAVAKVDRLVSDALARGGEVLTGGSRHELAGRFYSPTVLSNATREMALSREEIFGPVLPVYSFKTSEEVVELANDTSYGLAAYFYSRDISNVWRVAEELEYGMVGINTGMMSTAVAPFGGVKESGIGREGSKYGIDEYVELKYLCFGGL